jgi:Transposase
MEAQTVDTLPPIAADHDPVRCLLAIELSKKSWIVAITTALSDKISRYTLDGCDWKGLLELMERIRTRVAREVGRPVEMISCYEAGYDGFWLHRLLERHGVRSHVIDPASVQVDRRARRAKTDHIDAKRLLRSLMAYLRGEPKVWSVLRVPSVAEEDDRRLHRERDRLIAERGQHVNRIKALCAIHGIYDYEPMRRDRMLRLEHLHTGDRRELPPRLKAEIARELRRLELIATNEDAERFFSQGLGPAAKNWPFLRGRLLLSYGAWLRRQRRPADARAPLREARDIFDALSAMPWSDRAREELRAAGETSIRRTEQAWEKLTPQELHIAQLGFRTR